MNYGIGAVAFTNRPINAVFLLFQNAYVNVLGIKSNFF